jgi:hypothetical protein
MPEMLMPEIDVLLAGVTAVPAKTHPADMVPPVDAGPAITRLGDVMLIGKHPLICGDSTNP